MAEAPSFAVATRFGRSGILDRNVSDADMNIYKHLVITFIPTEIVYSVIISGHAVNKKIH